MNMSTPSRAGLVGMGLWLDVATLSGRAVDRRCFYASRRLSLAQPASERPLNLKTGVAKWRNGSMPYATAVQPPVFCPSLNNFV